MDGLLELIQNDRIGKIVLGISKKRLFNLLGDPDEQLVVLNGKIMYSYRSCLEFYFDKDTLEAISMRYDQEASNFKFDLLRPELRTVLFKGNPSLDRIVEILDDNEISWSIDKQLCDDTHLCLRIEDNKLLFYSLQNHGIYSLKFQG